MPNFTFFIDVEWTVTAPTEKEARDALHRLTEKVNWDTFNITDIIKVVPKR